MACALAERDHSHALIEGGPLLEGVGGGAIRQDTGVGVRQGLVRCQ